MEYSLARQTTHQYCEFLKMDNRVISSNRITYGLFEQLTDAEAKLLINDMHNIPSWILVLPTPTVLKYYTEGYYKREFDKLNSNKLTDLQRNYMYCKLTLEEDVSIFTRYINGVSDAVMLALLRLEICSKHNTSKRDYSIIQDELVLNYVGYMELGFEDDYEMWGFTVHFNPRNYDSINELVALGVERSTLVKYSDNQYNFMKIYETAKWYNVDIASNPELWGANASRLPYLFIGMKLGIPDEKLSKVSRTGNYLAVLKAGLGEWFNTHLMDEYNSWCLDKLSTESAQILPMLIAEPVYKNSLPYENIPMILGLLRLDSERIMVSKLATKLLGANIDLLHDLETYLSMGLSVDEIEHILLEIESQLTEEHFNLINRSCEAIEVFDTLS